MLPRKPSAKPTIGAWLQELEDRLSACDSHDQVVGVLLSNETLRASRVLTGAAKERLCALRTEALARHPEVLRQDDQSCAS
jgi:hypothetical protein